MFQEVNNRWSWETIFEKVVGAFATSNKCLYCLTFQCNVFEPLPLVSRAFNWLLVTLHHQPSSGSKRASGNRRQEAISNLLKSCKPAPSTIGHPWIATLVPSWFGHPPRKTNKVPDAWIGKWWKGKKFGMVWPSLPSSSYDIQLPISNVCNTFDYICVYARLIIPVYVSFCLYEYQQ